MADEIQVLERPLEDRFRYGSERHQRLVTFLAQLRQDAELAMAEKRDSWDEVDEMLEGKIDLSKGARYADGTQSSMEPEMPFRRAVVIPYSAAVIFSSAVMTFAVFSGRDPVVEVIGTGEEDVEGEAILTAALALDLRRCHGLSAFWQMAYDAKRYGIAVWHDFWMHREGWVWDPPLIDPRMVPPGMMPVVERLMPTLVRPRQRWTTVVEGSVVEPINPRLWWADPNVGVLETERMGAVGHRFVAYLHELESEDTFNLKEVERRCQAARETKSPEDKGTEGAQQRRRERGGPYPVDRWYVRLRPREWELGESERWETWVFEVVDDKVLVKAYPQPEAHGLPPYSAGCPLPDKHQQLPEGPGSLMLPIQKLIDWLVNSHFTEVRRWLNNAAVYAPSLIEEEDLYNPDPVGHVRLSPEGERALLQGHLASVTGAMQQLVKGDVTTGHLRDAQQLMDALQREWGASDPQMAMPLPSKRTATEVQRIVASATQRIVAETRLLDDLLVRPTVERMIANRQQFTSVEQWVRVSGALARRVGVDRLLVNPALLGGRYDYVPVSGVLPSDPATQAGTMMQVLELVAQIPQLADPSQSPDGQAIDLRRLALETIRALGLRNVDSFLVTAAQQGSGVQVVPDEEYQRGVQEGDYVAPQGVPGGVQ